MKNIKPVSENYKPYECSKCGYGKCSPQQGERCPNCNNKQFRLKINIPTSWTRTNG